ncbi:MAG TPA: hypothetical protein VNM91_05485 [Dehalococcoidia bacterium]|nr:hypothetical protein [Dehalococcoidia bacterium]
MPAPLPATDPYVTLRLHPSAPRGLVVQAYLALLRRPWLRANGAGSDGVRALDEAYALLMDTDRRAAYDRAHPAPAPAADDLYAILGVHPSADDEIIRVAYDHACRAAGEHSAGRQRIEEALRTLSNPQLRARYDTMPARTGGLPAAAATPGGTSPGRRSSRDEGAAHGATGRSIRLFGRRNSKAPRESAAETRLRALRDPDLTEEAASPAGAEPAPGAAAPAAGAGAELVFVAGPHAGRRIPLDGSPFVLEDLDAASRRPARVGQGETWTTIWRQGGSYLLRHPARKDVRIGGRRSDGLLVVLEDGDEITIGAHAMRFSLVPTAS